MRKFANTSFRNFIPALFIASILVGPVGAMALNMSDGATIDKQGAGLVLYVSLQRNAMTR